MFFWNMYIFVIDNYKINLYLINFCNVIMKIPVFKMPKKYKSKDYITLII